MKKLSDQEKFPSLSALKTILNGMDVHLYVSDPQTDEVLFINDRMKEHYNLGDDAVGGVCWKTFQCGLKKRCDLCPVDQLLDMPNTPVVWEERSSVTGRYYRNVDRIIEWTGGKKVHLRHSMDITDTKLAEVSLKKRLKQQELMSSISQSFTTIKDAPSLIYDALKMSGEFMGVNQAFLSKYKKDEGVLECLHEWCDEDGTPFINNKNKWPISSDMDIYEDLTSNGFAAISDYSMLTHPNFEAVRGHDLRAFLNFSIEVAGEFWGVLGFIINKRIYNWDESDIHLGKLIAGIFSGVIRRNIAEEKLFKAKEAAEFASRAKGDFLSNMSHEIRTPMNAIIGMTRIAQNTSDLQRIEYCLDRISSASKHLLGVINDILDMSKIEANKLELSPEEFDFERMLMNITGVVNARLEEKRQNLIISIDRDIPTVLYGDEMRLSQVIANLLSNAVKFTPEGGLIRLNAYNVYIYDGVATLLFEVIDNGIGISEEQQARLFKPFEQADSGTARRFGGSGLGLSISKNIVNLMDGRICIESEVDKGTKFSFTAKMKIGKGYPQPMLSNSINKDNVHILVVEEDPEISEYFRRSILELGLKCDVADDETVALQKIKQNRLNPYNIFFIDCCAPNFNGIELTKKIKRISRDNTVIILSTTSDWNIIEKDAMAAGVDKFIFKPLFPSMLIDVIDQAMGIEPEARTAYNPVHTYNFKDQSILVAEDIEINREIISALLEETRVSIDFAVDGTEAVSMFENNNDKYNLILMDVQMPTMDGYEATQKIRSMNTSSAKYIPIVAMTANVFREDIEKCIQSGMNDHIGKPVDAQEFLAKLEKYLHSESETISIAN